VSSDWEMEQEASRYSMWLVATIPQRCEHLITSMKRFGSNTFGFVHCTVQNSKWSQIPTGVSAFLGVYEEIKKFDRKYGDIVTRYSLVLHGKRGTPKGHTQYMHGCYINYARFEGKLTISKVNRKVPCFVAMLRTARQYGGVFEQDPATVEQRLANVKRKMLEKKVFRS